MESTTLITFLLQTPQKATSIHLLGSWDNFSKAYPMRKDTNIGNGHWRGCHSFTDIICDGDAVQSADAKRDGGLLMGGRYWYYYQIDDDFECHDPTEPSTRCCPFLPGQEVNVLEVPVQVDVDVPSSRLRSGSVDSSVHYTLNPEDKYLTPRPPTPSVFAASRNVSNAPIEDVALPREALVLPETVAEQGSTQTNHNVLIPFERVTTPPHLPTHRAKSVSKTPSPRKSSSKLRRWRSMITRAHTPEEHIEVPLPNFPRLWSSRSYNSAISGSSFFESDASLCESRAVSIGQSGELDGRPQVQHQEEPLHQNEGVYSGEENLAAVPVMIDGCESMRSQELPSRLILDMEAIKICQPSSSACFLSDGDLATAPFDYCSDTTHPVSVKMNDGEGYTATAQGDPESSDSSDTNSDLHQAKSVISSRTSGVFSSIAGASTPFTTGYPSWRNSQPLTPTCSEFGEFLLDTNPASASASDKSGRNMNLLDPKGFNGYNLSDAEHGSALTLRNLESAASKSSQCEKALDTTCKKDFVQRWNDGGHEGKSALQELVDDLGYLGEMIA